MSDQSLTGRRICVIEDEVLIADNLCAQLTEIGAHVVGPAGSIGGAMTLLQDNPNLDAAVLDIKLGDKDADAVARTLADRGIPFVFLTGYVEPTLADRFPDAPICEKPTTMAVIASALSRVIEKR